MAVGYPYDVSTTITPMGITCYVGHCDLWALQLGRVFNCFSFLAAGTAPWAAMRMSFQGGSFKVSSSSSSSQQVLQS